MTDRIRILLGRDRAVMQGPETEAWIKTDELVNVEDWV